MDSKFTWLEKKLNTDGISKKDIHEYIEDKNNKNLSELEFLQDRLAILLRRDVFKAKTKNNRKLAEIQSIYNEFMEFCGTKKVTEALIELGVENKLTTYRPQVSKMKSFTHGKEGDINMMHKVALSLSILLENRQAKKIHHQDVYHYLLGKNVGSSRLISDEGVIERIIGSYLLFRLSNVDSNYINISYLKMGQDEQGVLSFTCTRKGKDVPETKTEGIFIKNTNETYIFLCLSTKGEEYNPFIETITILKNPLLKEGAKEAPIEGLYNGETLSNDTRRPYSSKVVMIRFKNDNLLTELKHRDIFQNHTINEIKQAHENLLSPSVDEKLKWGETLKEINEMIEIPFILDRINNEIDKYNGIFLLKR